MNDLMNPFAQPRQLRTSTRLKSPSLHQSASALGHLVKSKSQKPLITARSSLRKTVFSVHVSLALSAIMNVYVANISA